MADRDERDCVIDVVYYEVLFDPNFDSFTLHDVWVFPFTDLVTRSFLLPVLNSAFNFRSQILVGLNQRIPFSNVFDKSPDVTSVYLVTDSHYRLSLHFLSFDKSICADFLLAE